MLTPGTTTITQLTTDADLDAALPDLAALLQDAVADGASVGWVNVPPTEEALAYWGGIANDVRAGRSVLWAAQSADGRTVGTVQLQFGQKENGRHRAELCKLLVHSAWRRRGVASRLLAAAEAYAWAHGYLMIFLDTVAGSAAQRLYTALGWQTAGSIPAYARSTTGVLEPTVFMYRLAP